MTRKLKEFLKENTIGSISICLSFIAIIISIITFSKNIKLQEKNTRYNTYNMNLSYQIEVLDEIDGNHITFEDGCFVISDTHLFEIRPKVGGVERFYFIFYRNDNIYLMSEIDTYREDIEDLYEAQDGSFSADGFLLDIVDEDDKKYYSSIILLIEDYKHNFFTHLIIFEIDKEDFKMEIQVHNEIELVCAYDKDEVADDFYESQLKQYLNFKKKLDEIYK